MQKWMVEINNSFYFELSNSYKKRKHPLYRISIVSKLLYFNNLCRLDDLFI